MGVASKGIIRASTVIGFLLTIMALITQVSSHSVLVPPRFDWKWAFVTFLCVGGLVLSFANVHDQPIKLHRTGAMVSVLVNFITITFLTLEIYANWHKVPWAADLGCALCAVHRMYQMLAKDRHSSRRNPPK